MSRTLSRDVSKRIAEWIDGASEGAPRLSQDLLQAIGAPAANDEEPGIDVELQRAMQRLVASGRWREARVILVEFSLRNQPEGIRLRRLSRLGIKISRTAYYVYLASGLAFIEGCLALSQENIASDA